MKTPKEHQLEKLDDYISEVCVGNIDRKLDVLSFIYNLLENLERLGYKIDYRLGTDDDHYYTTSAQFYLSDDRTDFTSIVFSLYRDDMMIFLVSPKQRVLQTHLVVLDSELDHSMDFAQKIHTVFNLQDVIDALDNMPGPVVE